MPAGGGVLSLRVLQCGMLWRATFGEHTRGSRHVVHACASGSCKHAGGTRAAGRCLWHCVLPDPYTLSTCPCQVIPFPWLLHPCPVAYPPLCTHRRHICTQLGTVVPAGIRQRHIEADVLGSQLLVVLDHGAAVVVADVLEPVLLSSTASCGAARQKRHRSDAAVPSQLGLLTCHNATGL